MFYEQDVVQRNLQKISNLLLVTALISQNQSRVFQIKETLLFEETEKFAESFQSAYGVISTLEEIKIMPERRQESINCRIKSTLRHENLSGLKLQRRLF